MNKIIMTRSVTIATITALFLNLATFGQSSKIEEKIVMYSLTPKISLNIKSNTINNRNIIWSDDFSDPNTWVINNGSTGLGAGFGWTIGSNNNSWYFTNPISSTSGGSFAEVSNGDASAQSQAPNVTYTMTTALPINIDSLANTSNVSLSWLEYGARFYDLQQVFISIDNGTTWTEVADNLNYDRLNQSSPNNAYTNPTTREIRISSFIASNPSQVLIRFSWTSERPTSANNSVWITYGWYIDDVSINTLPDDDVVNQSSWIFGENSNGAEYGRTPISQVEPNYYVGASVYNFGTNIQSVTVNGDFNGPTSFTTTASVSSILSDSTEIVETLEPSSFSVGVYNGVITALSTGDSTGSGNFGDNINLRNFEITNDIYSLDGIGNNPAGTESLSSIGTASFTDAEDGLICATMYPFYANDTINSVRILINGSQSSAGAEVIVRIIDSTSFRDQLFNNAIFSSNTYTVTSNDITQEFIEIPVGNISSNGLLFESLPIQAGNYYITIEMFSFTNLYDIAIMDDNTVGQPAWSSAIFIPNDQNYTNGNAFAIRVNLGDKTGPNTTGITENINAFSIYPNPTNGIVNILSNGNELSELTVKDITGKIVLVKNFQSIISINLDNYGKGVYIVDVKNNLGFTSKKISVQ